MKRRLFFRTAKFFRPALRWAKLGNLRNLKLLRKPLKYISKDPFGNVYFLKSALITVLGLATYPRLNFFNKLKIENIEYLHNLPSNNVLFISNHQTYYADVIALFHIFASTTWKLKRLRNPFYLLRPKVNIYYIAAEETMKKSGIIPKVFSYAGAITVKRSWRAGGQDVQRNADISAPAKIKTAMEHGWVVTFPQGTTKAGAPVRKGAANIIKQYKPLVVPVYIDGFRRAFDKRGLVLKKRGTTLTVRFSEPVQFGDDATLEEIQAFIEKAVIISETGNSPEEKHDGNSENDANEEENNQEENEN